MKKTKVAFFADILIEDSDGAARTMFQLLRRIPANRFDFLFVCGVGPNSIFGFECFTVPTVSLPVNANYKLALPQFSSARLLEKLRSFEPDVVHIATPSLLGQFALNYAERNDIPVISIYHTHFISYIDYYLKQVPFLINIIKSMVIESQRKFYNRCDTIYIPSGTIAEELTGLGVEAHRIKIWKRGIDRNLFSPFKKDRVMMQRLTGNDYPVILFASRLVWEKNLKTLFRIYDTIQSRRLKYNFVVAGDGVASEACEEYMKEAVFTGKLDHESLSTLYASADVFLFTSISETIGNVVLEAMASGLPCVIADGGGSRDFIQQGITGFKCDPNNEDEYAEKIELIMTNKNLHQKFANEGLKHSQLYNWQNLADIYFTDVLQLARQKEFA